MGPGTFSQRGTPGLRGLVPVLIGGLLLAGAGAGHTSAAEASAEAELSRLREFLTGADRTFATRRDTADVLLEKDTPEARALLLEVLSSPASLDAARAVLEALAARDHAHADLIDPLFALLAVDDEAVRAAAARAFGAYQDNEKVLAGLKQIVTGGSAGTEVRLAAVEALAQFPDKEAIAALVDLTDDPQAGVAAAAADALTRMTGLKAMPATGQAWAAWWRDHRGEPEPRLLARFVKRLRETLKDQAVRFQEVRGRLVEHLTEQYEAADAKGKGKLALAHLADPVPAVRALAARQAAQMGPSALASGNGTARKAYQDLVSALLGRVDDASAAVRAAVAGALAAWRESAAGPVLLARLRKEEEPEVRAALASALGTLKVPEAVDPLVAMLEASSRAGVVQAAGALGQIGDRSNGNPEAVEGALAPLGRLARTAGPAAVREAACLALARIAPPSAEKVLAAALDDPQPSVRYAAAQGIGNLDKVGKGTIAALVARLRDEDKGVRQAVAAALAQVGGPEAAAEMANRLKPDAEPEPAARNALWDAIRTLAEGAASADLAARLGDVFFARGGPENADDMQRAAELYQVALSKIPAAERSGQPAIVLYEKLVDAYLAAGTPERAVPTLRQLIVLTPAENTARLRELNRQLGLILLAKDPCTDSIPPLAAAIKGADAKAAGTILDAVRDRAEALLTAGQGVQALELLVGLHRAVPDWGGTDRSSGLEALRRKVADAALQEVLPKLAGTEEQAAAAATTLKKIGAPAAGPLLDRLEAAARKKNTALETRVLAALEAVTGRTDHGYAPDAPLAERLAAIEAWRKNL